MQSTARCEDEYVIVSRTDEEVFHPVFFLRRHAGDAAAAPPLFPIGLRGEPLDIAFMRNSDHHFLVGDQIFIGEILDRTGDLGAPVITVLLDQHIELLLDDVHPLLLGAKDCLQLLDRRADFLALGIELLGLQSREPRQAHIENRFGLPLA